MKRTLISLALSAAGLALPTNINAWIACGHAGWGGYHRVAWGGGCWHGGYPCGGVSTGTAVAAGFAGLATGALIGSAVAHANTPAVVVAPAPVVYPAPYYSTAYYSSPPVVVPPVAAVGSIYYSLPPGAQSANINGTQYYVLGSTYYRPYFGNNGVYYEVVANPI